MSDIITIPAGVIMPKDLLMWLRKRRDDARAEAEKLTEESDEYDFGYMDGRAAALDEVIQHISFGGAS